MSVASHQPVRPKQTTARISSQREVVVWAGGAAALVTLLVASLFIGSGDITASEVIPALRGLGNETTVVVVRDYRVPRTLMAAAVGVALGTAGTLMQSSTRNPLADPGLLGINSGAYLAVVLTSLWTGSFIGTGHVLAALAGAAAATVIVHGVGNMGVAGGTPAKLVLTGVALSAVLTGVATSVSLLNPEIFDRVRHWNSGSLQGTTAQALQTVAPFIVAGLVVAMLLPRRLGLLTLGEETATSLGINPRRVRLASAASVTFLCGAATAAVGPVSFVGLLVPHALRLIVGPSVPRILGASVLAGPVLVLAADIAGRLLIQGELPMGVVTAFIGAPVLVVLVRLRGVRAL